LCLNIGFKAKKFQLVGLPNFDLKLSIDIFLYNMSVFFLKIDHFISFIPVIKIKFLGLILSEPKFNIK